MADADLLEVLTGILESLPGIEPERSKGGLSFGAGGKVVAFTIREGVAMKLPADRIGQLLARKRAEYLVMGKRAMKEWAYLERPKAADFRKEAGLFKEALDFVTSLEAGKKPAKKAVKGKTAKRA